MSAGQGTGTATAVTGGGGTGATAPATATMPMPVSVNSAGTGIGASTSAPDISTKTQTPASPTVAAQDYSASINNNNREFSSSTATIRLVKDDSEQVVPPIAATTTDTQYSAGQPSSAPRTAITDDYSLSNSGGPVPPEERLTRSSTFPLATPIKSQLDQYSSPADTDSPSYTRRPPASRSSHGHHRTSDGPPISLRTQRLSTDRTSSYVTSPTTASPSDAALQGQRELLLPKSLSSNTPDERRSSSSQRPPLSYKAPANIPADQQTSSNPVRVPPIRGFRSSGSRKSLTLDMNSGPRSFDLGDEQADSNYDRTLRALEGRQIAGVLQMTPPASARRDGGSDGDDGGDVFLRIAREEGSRRNISENVPDETQSTVVSSTEPYFPVSASMSLLVSVLRQPCFSPTAPTPRPDCDHALFTDRLFIHANFYGTVTGISITPPPPLDECRIISSHIPAPCKSAVV